MLTNNEHEASVVQVVARHTVKAILTLANTIRNGGECCLITGLTIVTLEDDKVRSVGEC